MQADAQNKYLLLSVKCPKMSITQDHCPYSGRRVVTVGLPLCVSKLRPWNSLLCNLHSIALISKIGSGPSLSQCQQKNLIQASLITRFGRSSCANVINKD